MKNPRIIISILFLGFVNITLGQSATLKHKINQIIQSKHAEVGVAIYGIKSLPILPKLHGIII